MGEGLYYLTPYVPPPPPPPPPPRGWDFRAIWCRDSEFSACLAAVPAMNLNAIECWTSNTTNLLNRMNQIPAGIMGWSVLGNWTPNTSGGTFNLTDAQVITIIDGIKDHPRNSHRYNLSDEPNISGYTPAQQDLCRTALRNRRNLIKAHDPLALVSVSDYRQAHLDPVLTGRTYGMWGGPEASGASSFTTRVLDEVMISYYPRPNVDVEGHFITDMAGWCDAAGMDYVGCTCAHDYGAHVPDYPTPTQYTTAVKLWWQTNSKGINTYIWYDAEGTKQLRDDPIMQTQIGGVMALVSP